MNKFECIDTACITTASRTYEVILVTSPSGTQTIVYVYNHDGQEFSLFHSLQDLIMFITNGVNVDTSKNQWKRECFDSEIELDLFLANVIVK